MERIVLRHWVRILISVVALALPAFGQNALFFGLINANNCLSFYPVDFFINMNGTSTGTAVSTTNLTTGTALGSSGAVWGTADANQTFGASIVTLPASVSVNGGGGQGCLTATQALNHPGTDNFDTSEIDPSSGSIKHVVISGWLVLPPLNHSGSYYDMVRALGSITPITAGLQVDPGNSGLACGGSYGVEIEKSGGSTTHSGCNTSVTAGGTVYFSLHSIWNTTGTCKGGTINAPCAELNIYTTSGTTFTQVGSTVGVAMAADSFGGVQLGNGEQGTFTPGNLTFQNIMVDYTNATFPNLPH